MRTALPMLAAILLAGCSTGVVKTGQDTYMIGKTSARGAFAPGSVPKADIYAKAVKFCRQHQGQEVETISVSAVDGRPFRSASAELHFKCVPGK